MKNWSSYPDISILHFQFLGRTRFMKTSLRRLLCSFHHLIPASLHACCWEGNEELSVISVICTICMLACKWPTALQCLCTWVVHNWFIKVWASEIRTYDSKRQKTSLASLFSHDDERRRLSIFFGGDSCMNSAAWCDICRHCTERLCCSGELSSKKLPRGMGSTILWSCERPEWNGYLYGCHS